MRDPSGDHFDVIIGALRTRKWELIRDHKATAAAAAAAASMGSNKRSSMPQHNVRCALCVVITWWNRFSERLCLRCRHVRCILPTSFRPLHPRSTACVGGSVCKCGCGHGWVSGCGFVRCETLCAICSIFLFIRSRFTRAQGPENVEMHCSCEKISSH